MADIPDSRRSWMTVEMLLEMYDVTHRDLAFPGHEGADITMAVFRRSGDDEVGPGIVWLHGGGMVSGDRFFGAAEALPYLESTGGTLISIEYRLAPEHQAPIPVEDCYAGLVWAVEHADELGFDPEKVILGGGSAGGGLAAGVALLARDRRRPKLAGLMLHCPMLDDRSDSDSIDQHEVAIGWSGRSNRVAWTAVLGEARGTDAVSPYDAPARAPWLGGLPPVHVSVGSADPFRSEDVTFAESIWRDGGDCELYVLPGGHHGYELMVPDASISRATSESRHGWFRRLLKPDDTAEAVARLERLFSAMGR